MTYKNTITMTTLSIIAIFAITSIYVSTNEVSAVSVSNFKMSDDTYAKVTFTFLDAVEETYFPVFKMTSSIVANDGTSFQLQGSVEDYPYLNEAMDQSYEYRTASDFVMYDYKEFVVDVDLVKGGVSQKQLHYTNCEVVNSSVDTLFDNAEGYTTSKTGFAMVNVIDFVCDGLKSNGIQENSMTTYSQHQIHDYGKHTMKVMAEDVHSYATFAFNDGIEKIDFPVFKMNSGFEEKSTQRPSFYLEGIATSHTLLDNAISKARSVSGNPTIYNDDFEVTVDFANDSKLLRTLVYSDCRIDDYKIDTLFDKEEGYTGKSGFAIVEGITVSCAGLKTKNYSGDETAQNNIVNTNPYKMGGFTQAIATITLEDGKQEKINFPVFKQTSSESSVTTKSKKSSTERYSRLNPSFQLQGVVGDYPILYDVVDRIRTRGMTSGSDYQGLFSVSVDLLHNDKLVKTYQYTKCRVTNYDTDTASNAEEGYVGANGFALVSTYTFECNGYTPINPSLDALNVVEKAKNESSFDKVTRNQWGPGVTIP